MKMIKRVKSNSMENKQAKVCNWTFPTMSQTRCGASTTTIIVSKHVRGLLSLLCYIKLLRRAYYLSLSICLKPANIAPREIPLVTFHKISKQGQYLRILGIDPYSSLPGLLSN